jgi:hypothetical protein
MTIELQQKLQKRLDETIASKEGHQVRTLLGRIFWVDHFFSIPKVLLRE